ncbi:hypothetical protein EYF80_057335 [Liparis tanakae]|uniref:Uncharacterized protein n=1 Tax=Liparis tanakae TaxID=230148 RepID=A0A4Z2EVW8_9TELE|nr:hypothetical protein EYF80_057335 [Liparis tanakae]
MFFNSLMKRDTENSHAVVRTRTRARRGGIPLSGRNASSSAGLREPDEPSARAPRLPTDKGTRNMTRDVSDRSQPAPVIDTHFVEDELQGAVEAHGCARARARAHRKRDEER